MSRSAANADNIALHLRYATEALAQAQQYLDRAVTLADNEEEDHGQKFAELRGAVATVRAAVAILPYDWDSYAKARRG